MELEFSVRDLVKVDNFHENPPMKTEFFHVDEKTKSYEGNSSFS